MREAAEGSERLEARAVHVAFGELRAVDGVDLVLGRTEVLGLIGPNGAGKTTLINVLSGFQRPSAGTLWLEGQAVTGSSPQRLAAAGLVRTFQNVRLFPELSVFENVEAGAVGLGARRAKAAPLVWELLERTGLSAAAHRPAFTLSHGDERRVGVLRALALRPRFVLLDEPAAGLDEDESTALVGFLRSMCADFACGLLVVDHDMSVIMGVCDRIQVLDRGKTICMGPPAEVRRDPRVIEAYLGGLPDAGG